MRFWSLGEMTRVAIDVSAGFKYKFERLTNPDRLFFDIDGARPDIGKTLQHVIPVGDGIVKQIRVAETMPGVTRVVLDLDSHAEYTAVQLTSPDRLIIEVRGEVRGKSRAAPVVGKVVEPAPSVIPPPEVKHPIELPVTAAPVAAKPLTATASAATPLVAARPEPRKFVPPPHLERGPSETPILTADLIPPPMPVMAKPSKPPGPPISTLASVLPPPPSKKVVVDVPASSKPVSGVAPEPAKRPATGDRSLTRVLGLKLGRVVIDPGHGGRDVGTHGPSGLYEKDVVLDVSRRLGALIESRLGSEVVYTRDDDTFIPLDERTQIANDRKADLFLSIHANSSQIRSAAGVEMYYLNFTTSKAAMDVAARENAGSSRSIYDLKELLEKIALKDKIDESREFASALQSSLNSLESKTNSGAHNRGLKRAPFIVLIGAQMPSVLAEIGFLTNAADEALLRKPEYRQKIAEALYKGIANYSETLSHFQVAQKR
ncbi:MAG TPA: N-acetylmuramoyl-L-alanine amidase [Bryobacteraceae bacterium]|nr:N-acetylmuramoyl-L-alanine amidase [Bryobacteraceae bacterium]